MKIGTILLDDSVYDESPVKYTIYIGRSGKGKYYNVIFPYKGHICYTRLEKKCVGFGKYIHPIGKTNILKTIVQMIESELLNYKKNVVNKNTVDKYIKKTNADRIRNMNTKELSEFLYNIDVDECNHTICIKDKFFIDASDIEEWLECQCDT